MSASSITGDLGDLPASVTHREVSARLDSDSESSSETERLHHKKNKKDSKSSKKNKKEKDKKNKVLF